MAVVSDHVGADDCEPGKSILHFGSSKRLCRSGHVQARQEHPTFCDGMHFCRNIVYITSQNYHIDMKNDHIDIIADIVYGGDV